jgi:hypothetical protein
MSHVSSSFATPDFADATVAAGASSHPVVTWGLLLTGTLWSSFGAWLANLNPYLHLAGGLLTMGIGAVAAYAQLLNARTAARNLELRERAQKAERERDAAIQRVADMRERWIRSAGGPNGPQ